MHFEATKGIAVREAAKTAWHRLKQARSAVMKFEATWAGIQFLFALGPIGLMIGIVLWVRGQRNRAAQAHPGAPAGTEAATESPTPVAAGAAANGLAR
ncbi:hypothetical protein [Mycobacterium sp. pR1184]|uniref:hypothetical protein n=1 Tax=Mycobacterium sp. pR1184 TaxID=3238981 RepID=UPI00351B331B